jgi:hypothetical protein
MADIRLQTIQRQDDAPLRRQQRTQTAAVGQRGRQEFVIAIEQVGHAALGNRHPLRTQRLVDLRHATVLAMTLHPAQGNHIQAEFVMRQGDRTFRFRPIRPALARAANLFTAPDFQTQAPRPRQRHHRAAVLVAYAHREPTGRTVLLDWPQHGFPIRSLPL